MALIKKTIDEFFQEAIAAKESELALAHLNSTSKVAIWRLLLYISAVIAWILQSIVGEHLDEINRIIATTKYGYAPWYREMTLNFQFGSQLPGDEIYYDNSGLTEDEVSAQKVVKHCSAVGVLKGVRLKVAGEENGVRAPLTALQETALRAYLNRLKLCGVRIYLTNSPPDQLYLDLTVYYNPEILAPDGSRLFGASGKPVEDAIKAFTENNPIAGVFVTTKLVDALQQVDGVVIPHVNEIKAKYGALPYMPFEEIYMPDAGYLVPETLIINYIPQQPI